MKKILAIVLIITLGINSLLSNQQTKIIKLDDFMDMIITQLPELKQNKLREDLLKNNLNKANELYNVNLTGSFSGLGNKIYPDGFNAELYNQGFDTQLKFSTRLLSGTVIEIGGGYSQIYQNGEYLNTIIRCVTYDPAITFSVSQPLLYNYFGFLDRFAIKDSAVDYEIGKLKKIDDDHRLLLQYRKLYFTWIVYKRIYSLLNQSLENARKIENQAVNKLKAGLIDNDNFQKSKYQVLKYQEQIFQAMLLYKNQLDIFGNYVNLENYDPDLSELELYYELLKNKIIENVDFEKTRVAKIFSATKSRLEHQKKISFNRLLPYLNLYADLKIKFHRFVNNSDNVTGSVIDQYYGDTDFNVGLEFRYPIGNFRNRAEWNESKLLIQDLDLKYDISKRDYDQNLNSLINSINTYKKIVMIKEQSMRALISEYQTEEKKFDKAQMEISFLLQTANSISTEDIELIKVKNELIYLYLSYMVLTE